jgi:hypothetical protein
MSVSAPAINSAAERPAKLECYTLQTLAPESGLNKKDFFGTWFR